MNKIGDTIQNYHVLVVEDDLLLGEVIKEAVGHFYHVSLLHDGANVLPFLQEQTVDLIILDLMLPYINGFDLLQAIREEFSSDELSIIIMSAISNADAIVEGFENGANDYVVKPAELSVMLARVNMQLRLRQLQAERNQYIHHLERGEKLRKQLNQIASHDLKNPLNNLRIAEGLLQEEFADHPNIKPLMKTVNVSLDMMEQIIESFLDVVAIQTSSLQLNLHPLLIHDIINNALTQYKLAATTKNIDIIIGDTEGIIMADAGRMAQIAGNLVSNAVKYSPKNSAIKIWTTQHNDYVRLNVQDMGAGVPAEERDRLFTEFGKLSTRPTNGETRTGLGLWIVKHLVELQDGYAGADFPHEGGSIFWVEMPKATDFN